MGVIRQLLNELDRGKLVRLQRLRGLPAGDNNGERRETLARSYRGDLEELIEQLEHADLVAIFDKMTLTISGQRMYLPNAKKYGVDDLRRFARKAFAGARLLGPSPFIGVLDEEEEEEDDDEEGEDEDDEQDEESEEDGDDEEDKRATFTSAAQSLRQELNQSWSRPRTLESVLTHFGFPVPQRLRTSRFQFLVYFLRDCGIELCLAKDPDKTVVTDDLPSPGISAQVLLRLAPNDDAPSTDDVEPVDDEDHRTDPRSTIELFRQQLRRSWSQPLTLASLLTQLGFAVPDRLPNSSFQSLVSFLERNGIECCLANDSDKIVLTEDATSPGISKQVLLRLIQGGAEEWEDMAGKSLPSTLRDIGFHWSQPRSIPSLLRAFGEHAPSRLRTVRFQALIASLRDAGLEARLADDDDHTILDQDAESPGIMSELLLRRRQKPRLPQPGRRTTASPPAETEVRKVVVVPEQPVIQRAPRPSDYHLAVLRLQFLTAVPSVERRTMPAWPKGYLDAATRGLSLRPQELTFLAALATGHCMGNHSPVDSISQLELALTREEWDALVEDFRALNPFQPDLVGAIAEQVSQFGSWPSKGVWQSTPAPSSRADVPPLSGGSVHSEPTPKAAAARVVGNDIQNVRSLGALDDMFDEK